MSDPNASGVASGSHPDLSHRVIPVSKAFNERKEREAEDMKWMQEASQFYHDNKFKEALKPLENLMANRQSDDPLMSNLALLRFRLGKIDLDQYAKILDSISEKVKAQSDQEVPEESTHILFNLALIYFNKKNFVKANNYANSIRELVQNSDLYKPYLHLATCIKQSLHPVQEDEVDLMEKVTSELSTETGLVTLYQAKHLVRQKQRKEFKKELKGVNSQVGTEQSRFEYLRANLEFLKRNLKKANKLLMNGMQASPKPIPSSLMCMFENNLGCIQMMLEKPHLAHYYYVTAIKSHIKAMDESKEDKLRHPLHNRENELVFNLSVSLLHSGRYSEAMRSFQLLLRSSFKNHPQLWLHMAECCIEEKARKDLKIEELRKNGSSNQQLSPSRASKQKGAGLVNTSLNVHSVGSGAYQKVLLSQSTESKEGDKCLSFHMASSCLENAVVLVNQCLMKPSNFHVTSKLSLMKGAIQLKQAYVYLCLDDFTLSLAASKAVLAEKNLPGGYGILARLYAAEALIFLDNIRQAIKLLDPKTVENISFGNPEDDRKQYGSTTVELTATKAIFTYNLAVAYMMRDELDKADELTGQLWSLRGSHRLVAQVLMARLYIQLKKGNIQMARDIVREFFSVQNSVLLHKSGVSLSRNGAKGAKATELQI